MTAELDHVCCEHATLHFDDAERAWAALAKFERQILALANGLRGLERTLNRRPHHGRDVNVVVRATSPAAALAIARTPATCTCPPGVLHLADCAVVLAALACRE